MTDAGDSAAKHMLTMGLASEPVYNKAPRIQATRLMEHFDHEGWELVKVDARDLHPDPGPWLEFEDVNEGLLADGIATSRSRTSAAIAELGLDPTEVRAVVIEARTVHVYRHSDRVTRQTMPIIDYEEPE